MYAYVSQGIHPSRGVGPWAATPPPSSIEI